MSDLATDGLQLGMFGKDAKPGAYHCTFTKADGTPCAAYATKGSQFCRAHDPALAEAVQAARVRGGKHAQATYDRLQLPPAPPVSTHGDVLQGLQDLISRLRERHLGVAETRALVDLYQSVVKLLPAPEDPRLAGVNWRSELLDAGVPMERIEAVYVRMVNHVTERVDLGKQSIRVVYVNNWRREFTYTPPRAEGGTDAGPAIQLASGGQTLEENDPLHGDIDRTGPAGQDDSMGGPSV